ncbi:hypothetical protein [uncultured Microscilla sp.]|uniref:hypothetical protein n=1 Tax=uncultured Microscilla sp. TaxID=432653 RepID=UPI0026185E5A|nr:hypothetical protein [uncultured Microscilla sp.]
MQRIIKILIVASCTLPLGFSPLILMIGFDAYISVLTTMSFTVFIPLAFVLYMYDTVLCMGGFKRKQEAFWLQMAVAVAFILLVGVIVWFSQVSVITSDIDFKDRGLIFVLSFMLFGAVLNNVADKRLI